MLQITNTDSQVFHIRTVLKRVSSTNIADTHSSVLLYSVHSGHNINMWRRNYYSFYMHKGTVLLDNSGLILSSIHDNVQFPGSVR